jgi:hypothetical protein
MEAASEDPFGQRYPSITSWVRHWEWIVIGADDYSHSLIRAVTGGAMIWEAAETATLTPNPPLHRPVSRPPRGEGSVPPTAGLRQTRPRK